VFQTAAVNVFNPDEIQHDSLGFVQQAENNPP
jgi:hypothetical protein